VWTFQATGIRIFTLCRSLDCSGQRNKDLSRLGDFGRLRPKQEGFVPFGGFSTSQAKVVRICRFWSSVDVSGQKDVDLSRLQESGRFRPKE
jgi:hypothetical protein